MHCHTCIYDGDSTTDLKLIVNDNIKLYSDSYLTLFILHYYNYYSIYRACNKV